MQIKISNLIHGDRIMVTVENGRSQTHPLFGTVADYKYILGRK